MLKKPPLNPIYALHKYLARNPQWGWHSIIKAYGREIRMNGSLLLADAEKVQIMLQSRVHTQFRSKLYKSAAKKIPGAPGILFQEGKEWQDRLQQVMPVFTKANLQHYTHILQQISRDEIALLRAKKESADLYMDITNIGLKLVLELGFGMDTNKQAVKEYGAALRDYKLYTMYRSYRIDRLGFGAYQVFFLPRLLKSFSDLGRQMKRQRELLNAVLIKAENRNNIEPNWPDVFRDVGLDAKTQSDELNHIYGAFNAIDYTLTCALYELSKHPEIRDRVSKELKDLDIAALSDWKRHPVDLPYTQAFMKEVFRYYPVAIAVVRCTGENMEAAGKTWPAGTETLLLIQSLHFNEEYWDAPQQFEPERFLTELKEPKAYIPFLTGSRKCIGQHLAELHFLHILHAFAQEGFPEVTGDFKIQPYLIPRLEKRLSVDYSTEVGR